MSRIIFVLALAFGVVACGNDDAGDARYEDDLIGAVEGYARTQIQGDPDALVQARSEGCAVVDTELDAGQGEPGATDDVSVSDVDADIDGDEATVSYRSDSSGGQIADERWVREDGEWKWDNC